MVSESARVTTSAESRFRIAAPNSQPRTASLAALDRASESVVAVAAGHVPDRRRIVKLPTAGVADLPAWLQTLPNQTRALLDDAERSDMVVMVAHAGTSGDGATLLGEACRLRGVTVTALVLTTDDTGDAALSATLSRIRPFATMIVVASAEDYVEDMLQALRA